MYGAARALRFQVKPRTSLKTQRVNSTRGSRLDLGYFFDARRACRVAAFARNFHLTRSGISARFATVFLARFHRAGAGNVCARLLLRCCHKSLLDSPGMERTLVMRMLESDPGFDDFAYSGHCYPHALDFALAMSLCSAMPRRPSTTSTSTSTRK
jgi:hypothetical protein